MNFTPWLDFLDTAWICSNDRIQMLPSLLKFISHDLSKISACQIDYNSSCPSVISSKCSNGRWSNTISLQPGSYDVCGRGVVFWYKKTCPPSDGSTIGSCISNFSWLRVKRLDSHSRDLMLNSWFLFLSSFILRLLGNPILKQLLCFLYGNKTNVR